MRNVQVPAGNDWLFRVQLQKLFAECVVPGKPVVDALEPFLRVRGVAGDKIKLLVFQRDHPTLMVQLVNADAVGDGQRGMLRKNSGAGIALFLR